VQQASLVPRLRHAVHTKHVFKATTSKEIGNAMRCALLNLASRQERALIPVACIIQTQQDVNTPIMQQHEGHLQAAAK
jgi:hypothetical protein